MAAYSRAGKGVPTELMALGTPMDATLGYVARTGKLVILHNRGAIRRLLRGVKQVQMHGARCTSGACFPQNPLSAPYGKSASKASPALDALQNGPKKIRNNRRLPWRRKVSSKPKKEHFPCTKFTKFRSKKHEDNTKIMIHIFFRFQSSDLKKSQISSPFSDFRFQIF